MENKRYKQKSGNEPGNIKEIAQEVSDKIRQIS